VPAYRAAPGWLSAMAQGEAISLLLRAHADSPARGFDAAARDAAKPFLRSVEDGGVRRDLAGAPFFEEYATALASFVLNGFIYALWGLWELGRFGGEAGAAALAEDGSATLRAVLARYDAGYWSRYDLVRPKAGPQKPASLAYHTLHIAQLRVTAAMTGDAAFAAMAERWRGYQRSWPCRVRYVAAALAYHGLRAVTRGST
jgi:heparosan-N-sulfate-glucuronate 5-epimerase